MPAQLLPVTGKRASLRTRQVPVSEPPASESVQTRRVSVWQLTQVLQVSATGPEPVLQVSVTGQMQVLQVSVTGPEPVPQVSLPEPVLQVSVSVLPPASRLHSLHWQVY